MKILHEAFSAIAAHAAESLPEECCGILLAQADNSLIVSRVLRSENVEKQRPESRYVLGHKAHIKAVEMEYREDVRIVGYYHSHPSGATQPSCEDIEHAVEGTIYLIIAVQNGGVSQKAAWRFVEDRFVSESLEVI